MSKKLTILRDHPGYHQARSQQATIYAACQGLTPHELAITLMDLCDEMADAAGSKNLTVAKQGISIFCEALETHLKGREDHRATILDRFFPINEPDYFV